jgi:peptidoglycan/LPS O-acetylase OafA/YrhL
MVPENKAPKPINYKFLDGLRGIGAFIVYICHFLDHFYHIPVAKWVRNHEESA